jgi:signal transduction histidine kinase
MGQRSLGYILLDRNGNLRMWGGALEQLGINALQEGKPVEDQLLFMEGLLPLNQSPTKLTMIKPDVDHCLDIHLFQTENGYGLILMDATEAAQHQAVWQQKVNEMALQCEKPSAAGIRDRSDQSGDSLVNFVRVLNIAAFVNGPKGQFSLLGQAPSWLAKICPHVVTHPGNLSPKNTFSFLDNFLHDAHRFWKQDQIGFIKSGVWIETDDEDNDHLLEATAMNTGQNKILLISRDNCMIDEKQSLIQKGRELALNQGSYQRLKDELEARVRLHTEELEKANACLAHELTQRKQLEQERTQMVLHLQQAQKMEAIGTLAGGIAHDFNNILSAVIGFSELSLSEIPIGSQLYTNLQQVLSAGQRAKGLIRQILTFSRQSKPEVQPVQVGLLAKEALKLLRASLPATIEIQLDIQSEGYVTADPTQLHQVIMNLCTNAGQAMQTDGGVLQLKLYDHDLIAEEIADHPDLQPGPYLELIVKDNGFGMPAEVQARIFEPFFTTKANDQGTGMGLSLVHDIVKGSGGTIQVTSRPKFGSTFRILLPAISPVAAKRKSIASDIPRGSERILFVDDEKAIAQLAVQGLGRFGYQVQAETDSGRALTMFVKAPDNYDLVITDMNMPKMNGRQLAMELMKIRPELPVILCSGYSEEMTEEIATELGIRGFLLKPVGMTELAKAVRAIFDSK